jgi:two-component system phosphate regulon sensor histidine kinase PhoR
MSRQGRYNHLSKLAARKAEFTTVVLHEVSTSLAAIRGSTEVLGTEELVRPEYEVALATIQAEARILTNLVTDLQTAMTAEHDDFLVRPCPVQVGTLLADAAAFARTLSGCHPVTATVTHDTVVCADPPRIGQVLRNLVCNAAKYSQPGAAIELCAAPVRGRIRIEVVDQGIGIDSADMPHIFNKFRRGRDQSSRTVTGAGVGLYLSRRIIKAHGAELSVKSVPGNGSTFAFELEVIDDSGARS